ncbi:multicomponent Na+:H+ antiporter subunit C [Alkalispirochaeta americana]|uniref:Multicomponent Na+:H+ antiporter subunit C n=1 Tax=Alkalispirochaeta americana TaxID=159291 RepID=A0A1N6T618_9SPIO|nr:cation:proton antiporter subunit C [Alkalispirochaeta americana]SIQ48704.1 multicomponent Na+:H+ antiporter subunit C [Alkalispirochaeta americana]
MILAEIFPVRLIPLDVVSAGGLAWYLAGAIFLVGLAGLLLNRRAVTKVIALNVLNSALVLIFILQGKRAGQDAPILFRGDEIPVDPLVQALMLTAIVVGVCVTALLLVLIQCIFDATGTTDIPKIEMFFRRKGGGRGK